MTDNKLGFRSSGRRVHKDPDQLLYASTPCQNACQQIRSVRTVLDSNIV